MRNINNKAADDIIYIKYHQIQTGWGFATEPDLFYYLCGVTGDNISQYIETCEVLLDYPKIGGHNIKDFAKKGH